MYWTIYNEMLNLCLQGAVKLVTPANTLGALIPQRITTKPK